MGKKKQKEEEKSEEQKQAFLTKMAKQFLNEAAEDGYDLSEIEDLSFRLMYIMVRFAYMKAIPKDDMSDEEWNEVHEISALFSIAHYGKGCEKDIRSKGLSYGEVKKAINRNMANMQKKVAKNEKANKG